MAAKAIRETNSGDDARQDLSVVHSKLYVASGNVELSFLEGKYNCSDIKTKAFGNESDAKKEQIEEFIRHGGSWQTMESHLGRQFVLSTLLRSTARSLSNNH